jgi:phosphoribosylaminoimidazolecarboxamide formyltransferase/IMP cyclohydrolase
MTALKRALISVSDKKNIIELAQALRRLKIEIISTGGTFRALSEAGIEVTEVADITHFPEMMDGRIKTLHPAIQGGILARRGQDDAILAEHSIIPIDLVVVNLYPFADTVRNPNATFSDAIENIDVGGPTMIRAAAKNCAFVTVLTNPEDYTLLISQLETQHSSTNETQRREYAAKAFAHTAAYDAMISDYFGHQTQTTPSTSSTPFPATWTPAWKRFSALRYGENPHQSAAIYVPALSTRPSLANTIPLQGKALSFNNLADANAALACVREFTEPACVIVKHANPCGIAIAETTVSAYQRAYATDPLSAFGGIISFNRQVDLTTVDTILKQQFVEVLLAPSFTAEALALLASKINLRVLTCELESNDLLDIKSIDGGILVQQLDQGKLNEASVMTRVTPNDAQWRDLRFAWQSVKHIKSNAIVYAKNLATVGIGAGQMSRSFSVKIAALKAEESQLNLANSVLASDAFFPFRDGVDAAVNMGVSAIIQPGGSIKDPEVIAAADEAGIAMVFTGMRHFKH